MKTPIECMLQETPNYTVFKCLIVLVARIFDLKANTNLSFIPKNVSFLGIVLFIKDTNVSMFLPTVFIYIVMLSLMRTTTLSLIFLNRTLPLIPFHRHLFCPTNL